MEISANNLLHQLLCLPLTYSLYFTQTIIHPHMIVIADLLRELHHFLFERSYEVLGLVALFFDIVHYTLEINRI